MSNRFSTIVVLAEDAPQLNLVRQYLHRAVHKSQQIRERVAPRGKGAAEAWVRTKYPDEVRQCRSRATRTRTLLIVVIDADAHSVVERRKHLALQLKEAGMDPCSDGEPIIVLIPKRHIETWILCLLGEVVNEQDDYSGRKDLGPQIVSAAERLYKCSRPNLTPPASWVESLQLSLPEWQKIER